MNSKKLGLVAAALTTLAAQAFANDAAKKDAAKPAAAATGEVCVSSSCGKGGSTCAGKTEVKAAGDKKITDKDACAKAGGKWTKAAEATHKH